MHETLIISWKLISTTQHEGGEKELTDEALFTNRGWKLEERNERKNTCMHFWK